MGVLFIDYHERRLVRDPKSIHLKLIFRDHRFFFVVELTRTRDNLDAVVQQLGNRITRCRLQMDYVRFFVHRLKLFNFRVHNGKNVLRRNYNKIPPRRKVARIFLTARPSEKQGEG